MNATINSMKSMLTLLITAVVMTTLPATAQEPLTIGSRQTLSMGQPPQNYGVLHVNAVTGHDQQGVGSAEQPYKTITQALRVAPTTSTVILLAPGHYSQESGESFPLHLRPGITIQGNSGETRNTLISGGGEFQIDNVTQNATIVTADRSGLANILVSNPKGSGVWITSGSPILRRLALVSNAVAGVQVTNGAPVIENSYFHSNQHGLTIQGNGHALIRGNYFEATGRAITVASPATPTINNNRIANNHVGIALKDNARPLLNANVLNGNRRNGVVEVESTTAVTSTPVTHASTVSAPEQTAIKPTSDSAVSDINRNSGHENPAVLTHPETNSTVAVRLSIANQATLEEPVATENIATETLNTETSNSDESGSASQPAIETAPAPITAAEQSTIDPSPVEVQQARLSTPDETVTSEVIEPAVNHSADEVTADGAISIAVIPSGGAEIPQNDSMSHERREGISKLLARLTGSSSTNEPSPQEESVALTTPNAPIADIPANNQRLPVPTATIPSGGGSINLTPPSAITLTQTFRYRVLVDMADAEDLEQLVPDAFRTRVDSRMFMQAGAYIDEAEAQERLEWLQENGIEGQVDVRN